MKKNTKKTTYTISKKWGKALKTRRFVDVIGGNPGLYDTKAAMLYDDENLYIGFWCEEPFPHATITQRDGLLWFENDLEVFIDGGDCYYELQINALNNIYEVLYIWQDVYEVNGWDKKAQFEILSNKALTFGGNHDRTGQYFWRGSHPRGNRWAYHNWDFPGLQTFVHIDGVLNDSSLVSKGWTAMIVLPWKGMKELAVNRSTPPAGSNTSACRQDAHDSGSFPGSSQHLRPARSTHPRR